MNSSNWIKKIFVALLIFIAAPILASVYGILHDQFTYSFCEEYYTKLKFDQFYVPTEFHNRFGVALVGISATWWTGIPIGFILGITSLIHKNIRNMRRAAIQCFALLFVVTLITTLVGWGMAITKEPDAEQYQYILEYYRVNDVIGFFRTNIIHSYSYAGGAIGLVAAVFLQIRLWRRYKGEGVN